MRRVALRSFVSVASVLRSKLIAESTPFIHKNSRQVSSLLDCGKWRRAEVEWKSRSALTLQSFATATGESQKEEKTEEQKAKEEETGKEKVDGEKAEEDQEKESESESGAEDVETIASEVPSVEELTINTLSQVNKEYKAKIAEKERNIAKLSSMFEENRKKMLSAYAEAENLRSRFARESVQMKKFAVQDFVKNLLGCLDNLDRAVESIPQKVKERSDGGEVDAEELLNAMDGLLTGVKMTQKEFQNVLSAQGVERYEPIDEVFDPNRHMARFELDDPSKEPGTIGIVTLSGYAMHGRIIRPAEVGVVKKREETTSSKVEEEKEASH